MNKFAFKKSLSSFHKRTGTRNDTNHEDLASASTAEEGSMANQLELDPYNTVNIPITKEAVQKILEDLDVEYEIENMDLLQRAMVHDSYCKENIETKLAQYKHMKLSENTEGSMEIQPESYEKLEILGDAVVGLAAVSYLRNRFHQTPRFINDVKSNIVDRNALCKFAKALGLDKYIVLSKQEEDKGGREHVKNLCDIFEGFIGAIYEDVNNREEPYESLQFDSLSNIGYQVCEAIYIAVLEEEIDFEEIIINNPNHKNKLQNYYQTNYHIKPTYKTLRIEEHENDETYTVAVLDVHGDVLVTATGETQKQAQQNAAKMAVEKLRAYVITKNST